MAKTDNKNVPERNADDQAAPQRQALTQLRTLGSLEDVLNSGASLEIKAACIELEIENRKRRTN